MKRYPATLLVMIASFSCTNHVYLHRIKIYLNSSTTESKGRYLSEDYRSWFQEKKGEGEDKPAALRSFMNWDASLHPDVAILKYSKTGNEWKVDINEQNDFSKLIGFPGWKGTEVIRFNSAKKIYEVVYIPDPGNPNYKKWFQPAVDWLQKNASAELDEVYRNGKLVQTNETAKEWVRLLQRWRKETGK